MDAVMAPMVVCLDTWASSLRRVSSCSSACFNLVMSRAMAYTDERSSIARHDNHRYEPSWHWMRFSKCGDGCRFCKRLFARTFTIVRVDEPICRLAYQIVSSPAEHRGPSRIDVTDRSQFGVGHYEKILRKSPKTIAFLSFRLNTFSESLIEPTQSFLHACALRLGALAGGNLLRGNIDADNVPIFTF